MHFENFFSLIRNDVKTLRYFQALQCTDRLFKTMFRFLIIPKFCKFLKFNFIEILCSNWSYIDFKVGTKR